MRYLPSLGEVLTKEIFMGSKSYTMFYRSGVNPNRVKYSVSLLQDNVTGQFVNGSYKTVSVQNGVRSTWRQDLLNNIGYGTETTPFRRGSAEEALEHMVTPYDNAAIFKDCVKDATLIRLFPKFFVQNSKGYKSVGMTATQELKNNSAYNQSMKKAVAQSETNFLKIA